MRTTLMAGSALMAVVALCLGCTGQEGGGAPGAQPVDGLDAFDTSNPALVAGFASDIFVGQVSDAMVLDEHGPSGAGDATATVRAFDVMKGGPLDEYNVFFPPSMLVYDESASELRPPVRNDAVYVFATKFDSQNRVGYVAASVSEVPGERAEFLKSEGQLERPSGGRSAAEAEMLWGIENSVPFGPDGFPLFNPPVPPWAPSGSINGVDMESSRPRLTP